MWLRESERERERERERENRPLTQTPQQVDAAEDRDLVIQQAQVPLFPRVGHTLECKTPPRVSDTPRSVRHTYECVGPLPPECVRHPNNVVTAL